PSTHTPATTIYTRSLHDALPIYHWLETRPSFRQLFLLSQQAMSMFFIKPFHAAQSIFKPMEKMKPKMKILTFRTLFHLYAQSVPKLRLQLMVLTEWHLFDNKLSYFIYELMLILIKLFSLICCQLDNIILLQTTPLIFFSAPAWT